MPAASQRFAILAFFVARNSEKTCGQYNPFAQADGSGVTATVDFVSCSIHIASRLIE